MSTFTQLYVHIIFGTSGRIGILHGDKQNQIQKYITGIIKNRGHTPIIINGMPDHIHILIGLNPDKTISDLVKEIKRCSTNYINEQGWFKGKFKWQKGYGAFSYGQSQLQKIIHYIKNQERHHRKRSFREEYKQLLDSFEIDYSEALLPK
jgi:putative transposase